jgi:hypothetical protein
MSDGTIDAAIHSHAKRAFAIYGSGIEQISDVVKCQNRTFHHRPEI